MSKKVDVDIDDAALSDIPKACQEYADAIEKQVEELSLAERKCAWLDWTMRKFEEKIKENDVAR